MPAKWTCRHFILPRGTENSLLAQLLESNGTPAVIHCTAGKDRTGIAVALILLACGVSVDEVLDDYEASNAHNAYHLAKVALAIRIASRGWTRRGQLDGLFVVRRATLASTLAGLEARHGTIAAFLSAKVGLTPDKLERLRALLLEPAN